MRWSPRRAMLVLVLCNLCWAGSYVAGKEALRAVSPVELNCLRFSLAGLILLPLLWHGRKRLRFGRRDLPRLGALCLCGFVVNKAAEYTGLNLTTASDTALLIASEGILTAALAWVALRERVYAGSIVGLLLGLCGVYIVVQRGFTLPHLGGGGTRLIGDLLVVLSLVFEAGYTVLGKAQLARYPGLLITAAGVIGSLAVWIPAAAINVAHSGMPHLDGAAWIGVVYMALFATVVPYVGWMLALRYVDAAGAAATLFIQPLVGTALAIVLLGERPSWATVAGGLCIMLGVWVASQAESRATVTAMVKAEALAS